MTLEEEQTGDSIDGRVRRETRSRLAEIAARSRSRVRELSCQFAQAEGADRERLFAEMEFERWLADGCENDLF